MTTAKNTWSQYSIWAIFFMVLGAHLFLALAWQKQFFLNLFGNSIVFTDAVSLAYQKIASLQFKGFELSIFAELPTTIVGKYWPPVVPLVSLWILLVSSVQWLFLPNFFYLAATMLGIYCSVKYLCGDRFYSMLAAVIFSCYWIVMVQLVALEAQLIVMACMVWSFYAYLRSFFFTRFWPSMIVGLFMAFGLYCDRATPGLLVFALFLVPENFHTKRSCLLMGTVLLFVTVCVWPFYGAWVRGLFGQPGLFFRQYYDLTPPSEVYRAVLHNPRFLGAHLSYYFISLTEKILGYGFTGLLILGTFFLHRLKKPYAKVLWTAWLVPLLAFISIVKKESSYIIPLCIYFAMISGIGIYFIRKKWLRYLLILSIAALSAGQYFLYFSPSGDKSSWFFSRQFCRMDVQKIPRLSLGGGIGISHDVTQQVRSVMGPVKSLLGKRALFGERKQTVIVDMKVHYTQFAVTFLLRIDLPEVEVINARFAEAPGSSESFKEGYLYLLSDKTKYAVGKRPGSGGGCVWKELELVSDFPGSNIVLYRVDQ